MIVEAHAGDRAAVRWYGEDDGIIDVSDLHRAPRVLGEDGDLHVGGAITEVVELDGLRHQSARAGGGKSDEQGDYCGETSLFHLSSPPPVRSLLLRWLLTYNCLSACHTHGRHLV